MPGTTSAIDAAQLADALVAPLLDDARSLEADGFASAAAIDTAMRLGAGHPKGPLEVLGRAPVPVAPPADGAPAVRRVGVVGSGSMATGIAEAVVKGGGEATLIARTPEGAEQSRAAVESRAAKAVQRGKLTPEDAEALLARLRTAASRDALDGVELVIEAVVERLDVKQQLLADLDRRLPGIPLATNTSSFRVAEVCAEMQSPERALALHFFNPAPAMRLVEVVGHDGTDPRVLELGDAWAWSIGKQTVTCGDASGFLVNRLLIPYLNDAARRRRLDGFTVAEADEAVTAHLGHPMGPFALMDLIGLDVMVFALETMRDAFRDERMAPAAELRELVAQGRLGRKSGTGFHVYEARA